MPIAPKAAEGSQEAASLEPLAVNSAVNKIIGVHKNKADRYEVSTQDYISVTKYPKSYCNNDN